MQYTRSSTILMKITEASSIIIRGKKQKYTILMHSRNHRTQKIQLAINPSIQIQFTNFQSPNWITHLNLQSSWSHQCPTQSANHPKMQHNTLVPNSRPKLAQKRKTIITQSYDIEIGNLKSLNSSIRKDLQFLFRTQRLILMASRSNNWSKKTGNYLKDNV